jgi:uncharacterized repeat protein (TIGR03833 family)
MSSGTVRKFIRAGLKVEVIKKEDQRTGKTTLGFVKDILTNSANHHQGIKVRLQSGIVGRVFKIIDDSNNTNATLEPTVTKNQTKCYHRSGRRGNFDSDKLRTNSTDAEELESNEYTRPDRPMLSDFIFPKLSRNTLECLACTFISAEESLVCDMCGAVKNALDWECSACTFKNPIGPIECTICMTPRVLQ